MIAQDAKLNLIWINTACHSFFRTNHGATNFPRHICNVDVKPEVIMSLLLRTQAMATS